MATKQHKFLVGHSNQIRQHLADAGLLERFDAQQTDRRHLEHIRARLEEGWVLIFWLEADGVIRLHVSPTILAALTYWAIITKYS